MVPSTNVFRAVVVAISAALLFPNTLLAGPSVTVENTPLPVSGTVNATITNVTVPVSGAVSATITNSAVPVAGRVSISGTTGVQVRLPAQPFTVTMVLRNNQRRVAGPGSGTLGVTSITITNFDTEPQQLFLFAPVVSGGDCNGAVVIGGSDPSFNLLVEPRKTLQLIYPTPLVFTQKGEQTCIAAEVTTALVAEVDIQVNGIVE